MFKPRLTPPWHSLSLRSRIIDISGRLASLAKGRIDEEEVKSQIGIFVYKQKTALEAILMGPNCYRWSQIMAITYHKWKFFIWDHFEAFKTI